MRIGAASLFAGLAVVAAGCGGGGGGGGGHALPAAADVVPASAPALISVNTDFTSPQWANVEALLQKFPDADKALRRLSAENGNVDFEHDVKPAVGPEVDVVFLDFRNGGNDVVGLTQPKDKAKFAELMKKGSTTGSKAYTGEVNGWTVVADSQAKVAAFRRAASSGDKLADVGAFKDAMSRLDEKAAVRAYVAGQPVQEALDRGLRGAGAPADLTREDVAELESISAAGAVEPDGVRTDSALTTDPGADPKTYTPTLADSLPAGAFLYLSTGNLGAPTKTILKLVGRSNPRLETQLTQVLGVLGMSLEGDVYPLLSGEQAFAVYPGKPVPGIAFVAKVPNPGRASDLVARVLQLAKLSGAVTITSFDVHGTTVDELAPSGSSVHVYVAVAGDKLIVTTVRDTMSTLVAGEGATLADDPLYKQARTDAKVPTKVAGLVYADLAHGLPFLFDLAESNGSAVPPAARTNTKPLSHALLYAHQDGKRFLLSGFVTIK